MEEKLRKWRLILGKQSNPAEDVDLTEEWQGVDDALDALYDSEREGGLGNSSPNVNRWLGDIRRYFPAEVVQMMQKDALEKLGLYQMLTEPELLEKVEPDVNLVATLLSLNKVMPQKTRESARKVVRGVVDELEKRLQQPMLQAIKGSIHRATRNRRPRHKEIDWNKTILRNLKHYQKEHNSIIPEQLMGYGRKGQSLKTVILLVDQSGSMATSIVYAGILGAVMASMRSLQTHMVVFDTSVIDLTEQLADPVDLLFATQLGGGTDINKALRYAEDLIEKPRDTILLLISDLYEGGNQDALLRRVQSIKNGGTQMICLLALSDKGTPSFDRKLAAQLTTLQVPTFACTPDRFPDLMAAAIKKEALTSFKGPAPN
ncbi:MAG: VWA domain-containing protein [Bacteroidota bacterium]